MTILILFALVLTALIVDYFVQLRQTKTQTAAAARPVPLYDFSLPEGVFADPGHVWSVLMPSGRMKLGINPLIIRTLGHIDSIRLPEKGRAIQAGQPLLEVVQGRKKIRVASPISGVIEEINPLVAEHGETVKRDVHKAWTVSIKPHSLASAVSGMRLGEEARKWLSLEVQRLRDFFAATAASPELALVMQDGGLPAEGVLQSMDQEIWNHFEREFLTPNNRDRA